MTEEEKDILIEKMTDKPNSLTSEDIDAILMDSELREIYRISSSLQEAASSRIEVDGLKEWELFRPRLKKVRSPFRWIMRVAAIFLGIVILSSVIVKIIDHVFEHPAAPVISKVNDVKENNYKMKEDTKNIEANSIASLNEKNEVNSQKLAVKISNSLEEELETEQANEIDIDEYLRIQEAKIENDLALLNAEMYLEEIEHIKQELESQGVEEEWIEKEIKKVTMQ